MKIGQRIEQEKIDNGEVVVINNYFAGLPVVTTEVGKDSLNLIPIKGPDGSVLGEFPEILFLKSVYNYFANQSEVGRNVITLKYDKEIKEFSISVREKIDEENYSQVTEYEYQLSIKVHRKTNTTFNVNLKGLELNEGEIENASQNNLTLTNIEPGKFKIECDFDFTIKLHKDPGCTFNNNGFVEGEMTIIK